MQRYLPWWRVADPEASTRVTVRHLLYQVSGLSKATGNAYATSGDTHDSALEDRVRALRDAELTEPVGTTWQYSNANYWTLGMIVQAVSGQSYETYIQQHIFDPLQMRNSYASRTDAVQHGLPAGHRYWYGFPVASELPFDRGGLGSAGLSSSAQDMTRYLGLYLNQGRHGTTALVSPAGAAELQRAGVPTGLDGVSYAMGWDVGSVHGHQTISHDGSGFDSHANVLLIPDRGWGVVVMEDGENSPDEFFGSRRMTGIAYGVAGMLIGEEPPPTSSSWSLWVVYGVVLGILLIQVAGMIRSVRTIRGWRTAPSRRPTGALRIALRVGPAPSRELELGSSRAGRTATGHPRAAAGRADGTARPRLPAGRQRRTRLRLGPGQIHLGNPHFAHSAFRGAWPLDGRHHRSDHRNRLRENPCPPPQVP